MIETRNLTKLFRSGKGIRDLSFRIEEGEVFGFLGPNGAGKTTTIRHFLGFLQPQHGTASIHGLDCWKQSSKIKKYIGYLPGEIAFLEGMSGLAFLQLLNGMRGKQDAKRQENLIKRFDLAIKTPVRKMSKGMKQKLGLVAAFMHDPALYILDEPTSGLDPLMQQVFLDLIIEEQGRGKTIFMSSHNFEEINRTCNRAGIIRGGQLVTIEDIASLRSLQRKVFAITVAMQKDIATIKQAGLDVLAENGFTLDIVLQGNYDLFFKTLASCSVVSIEQQTQTLEHIFMQFYQQQGDTI